jgi:hypothetical protein
MRMRGGSKLTLEKELAVMPTRCPSWTVVTTVTPLAHCANVARKVAASTAGEVSGTVVCELPCESMVMTIICSHLSILIYLFSSAQRVKAT